MLAAVLRDFNDLALEEVPIPDPGLGEVVIRIAACGFCATDYKAIKGIRRNLTFPAILGHEPSGVVAAVGPGVTPDGHGGRPGLVWGSPRLVWGSPRTGMGVTPDRFLFERPKMSKNRRKSKILNVLRSASSVRIQPNIPNRPKMG